MKEKLKRLARVAESKINRKMSGETDVENLQVLEKYQEDLFSWKHTYLTWIEKNEGVKCEKDGSLLLPSFDAWRGNACMLMPWVLIRTKGTRVSADLAHIVIEKCIENPSLKVIYADEDYYWLKQDAEDSNGVKDAWGFRTCPFFKPDYSPETLDSFCYFGEMVLINREVFEKIPAALKLPGVKETLGTETGVCLEVIASAQEIYQVLIECKKLLKPKSFGHIPLILSHRDAAEFLTGCGAEVDFLKVYAQKYSVEQFLKNALEDDKNIGKVLPGFAPLEKADEHIDLDNPPKVSVVILSKDNPKLLETCIFSINDITKYPLFEIIVVDNGSSPENRQAYENLAFRTDFAYYYHPMEFNFSALCNFGVEQAEGDLILLMNDDVEVIYPEYMEKMAIYASRPEIGAVGAKLLYSDKDSLQHVGVTSLGIGPSHQLQRKSDKQNLYFGRNRADYNAIAVTAACLMIKRSVYDEVGGLNEDLKVAYNDVDFCMKVAEHGYRNVQCNSAVLVHHESLTRGYDGDSEEKWNRLLGEKEKLYALHPEYKAFDPYHNPNLIDNSSEYICNIKTKDLDTDWHGELQQLTPFEVEELFGSDTTDGKQRKESSIKIRQKMDKCQIQRRFSPEGTDYLWVTGWGYIPGADQLAYKKTVILYLNQAKVNAGSGDSDKNREQSATTLAEKDCAEKTAYKLTTTDVYRPDAAAVLDYEKHIELCGFLSRIPLSDIPSGEYKVGVLWEGIDNNKKKIVWDGLIKL